MTSTAGLELTPATDVHSALRRVGERLTESAIEWGRRPASPARMSLTPRDREILSWLEQHRFAATSTLALLFWGAKPSTAPNMRLKLLHDAGYVDKCRARVVGGGSSEWIYRLARRGWDVLWDNALNVSPRLPSVELNDLAYAAHDLQLDATLLAVAAAELPGDGPLLKRLPFEWQGPDLGRVERDGGTPTRRQGLAAQLPEGHIIARANSLPGVLEPDATWNGTHATSGLPMTVMFEYDRTRRPAKQRDRWRRYDRFLAQTWRDSRFGEHHCAPPVIYLLAQTKLIPAFLREADKHLTAWVGPQHGGPWDGTYPGRDLVLFTSRERLFAGDWTIDCVPALPPERRKCKSVAPRTADVPLMRLWARTA
jgi:hypothetical protein